MTKLILGIAGEIGSGKGIFAKHLVQTHGASSHKFSQMLRDILERLHLEDSRENIVALSTNLRRTFGEDILAKTMYHDTFEDRAEIIVIDGIRRHQDMKFLKEIPHFKFVYIDADIQNRYERIVARDENENEGKKTFSEFQESHNYETEKTIPDLRNYADVVIENNGTYADFYKKIDELVFGYINN